PGASGLELIETLRKRKPELRSIILTHHEDFGFAKQAISLGALEYILKSDLTPERLLGALNDARESIPRRASDADAESRMAGRPSKGSDERFLELLKGEKPFPELRKTAEAFFGSLFVGDSFLVGTVYIQWKVADGSVYDSKLRRAIEDVCEQVVPDKHFVYRCAVTENRILYLFNFDGKEIEDSDAGELILQFMNRLMNNVKKYFNLYLSIGISQIGKRPEKIPELFIQSQKAQEESFFEHSHIRAFRPRYAIGDEEFLVPDRKRVERLLTARVKDQLSSYLETSLEQARKTRDYGALQTFAKIFIEASEACRAISGETETGVVSPRELADISGLYDFESTKMYLLSVLDSLFEKDHGKGEARNSFIVKKCIRFIQDHYAENISLSNLARHVEVSRSYLSFLFKQELGVNFSHYLINTRIENAKRLLLESNMKIYEIAENVGFDSPYYFSKVFKEITGKPCKEYRSEFYEE
ncbi:MAG: helix-turn-helix domain-containing protein, partial [Treponemataceae bacterium]